MRGTFVLCVCGESHARRVATTVRFLKRFTKHDVIAVVARSGAEIGHDQVLRPSVPAHFTDRQAAIFLKASLPRILGSSRVCCYVDSDQIATSSRIDDVFDRYRPPITFARDHGDVADFSRYAVRCGCPGPRCDHLVETIRSSFGVVVGDRAWHHWNGGLFLFDQRSASFCATWSDYTLLAFDDARWHVRDQGTLIAAVWKHGLERHPTLSGDVTRIVDRYRGVCEDRRAALPVGAYACDTGYTAGAAGGPAFLHFINDGVGATGWANWDAAAALLHPTDARVAHA